MKKGKPSPRRRSGSTCGWRKKPQGPTPTPTPKPGPVELDVFVAAENYMPGVWSCQAPSFTLSGIPEGARGYNYAVVAYDERFIILSGNAYTSRDEGEYSLRFAILDPIGDVCALSTRYDLKIDLTPPAYMTASIVSEGQPQFILTSEDRAQRSGRLQRRWRPDVGARLRDRRLRPHRQAWRGLCAGHAHGPRRGRQHHRIPHRF